MASPSEAPAGTCADVLALVEARAPTLGTCRLLCIDGPAGSGKTTAAAAVLAATGGSTAVVHMDDLYDGWSGLPHVGSQLATILEPLARGEAGRYRRYDWSAGQYAETVAVPPVDLLVLEGVGSGLAAFAPLRTVLVWIEADEATRLGRWRRRDGDAVEPFIEAWCDAESAYFTRERTREAADVIWSTSR